MMMCQQGLAGAQPTRRCRLSWLLLAVIAVAGMHCTAEAFATAMRSSDVQMERAQVAPKAAQLGFLPPAVRSLGAPVPLKRTQPFMAQLVVGALALGAVLGLRSQVQKESSVIRRSLKSCYTLYFRRENYRRTYQRECRNRAYNIYHKNRYKRQMRNIRRQLNEWEFEQRAFANKEEVIEALRGMLDIAFLTIDEVTVQGVIDPPDAVTAKDYCLGDIIGFLKRQSLWSNPPEETFTPKFILLGYKPPPCMHIREPRPWQLPGWKSVYDLKKEFEHWARGRNERMKAAAKA